MPSFHGRTVRRSRKARPCFWCGETIEIKQPYRLWRWADDDGTAQTINVHPECGDAWDDATRDEYRKCYECGPFEHERPQRAPESLQAEVLDRFKSNTHEPLTSTPTKRSRMRQLQLPLEG